MSILLALSVLSLVAASLPLAMVLRNLSLYRRTPAMTPASLALHPVSVLVPARDEAASIGACLDAIRATRDVAIDVLVLDDGSTDDTAAIVRRHARLDERVRLVTAPELPPGWCGKQHACATLASLARHESLLFVDADVRLAPDAIARLHVARAGLGVDLLSGFPRQITGTRLEKLLIPLIHFVLLGYLPFDGMRRSNGVGFAAGCGQLMFTDRGAYRASGGHAAIRSSLHDGVKLPRAYRRSGFTTGLVDATDLARCRMYRSGSETWRGLGKNATEGLAAPGAIVPMSLLLLFGAVLPLVVFLLGMLSGASAVAVLCAASACLAGIATRLLLARRFAQSIGSALLHPVGVLTLLGVQWQAALARARGEPSGWKGRHYGAVPDAE